MDNIENEKQEVGFLENYVDKDLLQAITFGIVTVILGILFSSMFSFAKPDLPQECEKWNDYSVLEMTLFLIGFTTRYLLSNSYVKKYLIN